jgi:hypothetical protein
MPAGFPRVMPGMEEESDGATQQAPQPGRQTIFMNGPSDEISFSSVGKSIIIP